MRFFIQSRLLNYLLIAGLLSIGQSTQSQQQAHIVTPTSSLESSRLNSNYFDLPLNIKPLLSGNFAELRVNHLHSGIDFKTQQSIGIPVHAPADGWVSRIRISSYGFGYALYLDHPNGFTTVYGHLDGYAFPIDDEARRMQYKTEQFELDTLLPKNMIPVRKGQIIAYTGNSGGSAGPHLHFEIRDTKTEETIDALLWYTDRIKDNRPPEIYKIAVYAIDDKGALSTGTPRVIVPVLKSKQGNRVLSGQLPTVWGEIGIGLNAYDYMPQTANKYGICNIRLFMDEELIFLQDLSRFSFNQTRAVNSMVDYELWQTKQTWIMKSFLDPGNSLNVYPTLKNRGVINIDKERVYAFRYELTDRAGNTTSFSFYLRGQKQGIIPHVFTGKRMIFWIPNRFETADIELDLPAGALYKTIDFQYAQKADAGYSDLYILHHPETPIHEFLPVRFRIQRDVLPDKQNYYLAKKDRYGRFVKTDGYYEAGWMVSKIREFGTYKILADSIPPQIGTPNLDYLVKNGLIRIRIADNATGISYWRGTIDDQWALFSFDAKSGMLRYSFDSSRLTKGQEHKLKLAVRDGCGNESLLKQTFFH
jgi:murein DD-endopeptidase MepM/ murein hydrolase activator NlpD